jgi:4-hydroxybenzoate polyprenyltransferase
MTVKRPRFLVYSQLLRLPNAFTAMADPLAGWFAVGGGVPVWKLPLLVVASACFYTSGIVFNGCFDYERDCAERPERPLPSGAVPLKAAWVVGATLMVVGLALAGLAGPVPFGVAVFLGAMIFFYNAWARRFTTLRPLVLGTCRFANFLLGMRCFPLRLAWMPALLGVYAGSITFLSTHEAEDPALQRMIKWMLLGIVVVDAIIVALSPFGDWIGALLVLSLLVPAFVLGKAFAMT